MKRDEIIAKWAGLSARERDAWVEAAVLPISEEEARDRRKFSISLPRYSTEISAAWTVMERMNPTHWVSVMRIAGEVNSTGNYVAEVGEHSAGSNSAPEAICLAALIAELTEVSADVAV
ncbi:hypothetical protein NSS79_10380 [Paenibacillus sp. FSL L8-0436]|uniref:BC1872 family protein n=1 Tax=Paenibacillus sp. FSL L8-0436 TaxID=2954686 RepID=UPI003158516C